MATLSFFNNTINNFNLGNYSTSDVYKVLLLNTSASFLATSVTIDDATSSGSWEVYGNNWSQGGIEIENISITVDGTNGSKFDGDDISQQITGGNLGPISSYIIANSTKDSPIVYIELDSPQTVLQNNNATFTWNVSGIIIWSEAP